MSFPKVPCAHMSVYRARLTQLQDMDPATRFTWRELKVYVGIMFILDLLHHVLGLVENFCSV